MIRFKLARSTTRPVDIVEVWDDEVYIASIYPNDPGAIHIMSKYSPKVREIDSLSLVVDFTGRPLSRPN